MKHALLAAFLLLTCSAAADTLLVVYKSDATLALIDPAAMKVVATLPTGKEPHEVVVSNDGIAVVGNYGPSEAPGTSLTFFDLQAKRDVKRVNLPGLFRPTRFRRWTRASISPPKEVSPSRAMTRPQMRSTGSAVQDNH